MSDDENDLFPRIIVNKNAKDYVETDEEEEDEHVEELRNDVEEETHDIPKVEKEIIKKVRKKKEIFQGVEEQGVEEEVKGEPIEKPPDEPVKRRQRKKPSQQQLDHLTKIRVKALEAKKKKKEDRLNNPPEPKLKPLPKQEQYSVSNIARDMRDEDVDKLIDRYKQRRKAKKEAKKVEEDTRNLIKSHYSMSGPKSTSNYMSDYF